MRLLPKDRNVGWTPFAWLVYLATFFIDPIANGASGLEWTLTLLATAAFLVLYFRGFWLPARGQLRIALAILAIGVLFLPSNAGAVTFFIYSASFIGCALSRRATSWTLLGVVALMLLECYLFDVPPSVWLVGVIFVPLIGFINSHFTEVERRNARLKLAHEEVERLAKLDERERIARDLHDLLGHSLAVITLKSQLASRLVGSDPERARAEMDEVERLSRETTNEVRRAVSGYRAQKLGTELAKARLALESAGMRLDVQAGPFALESEQESVVALALREGVTNVVRHSRASRCTIRIDSVRIDSGRARFVLEVEDDGRGVRRPEGSGLTGMRERIAPSGGTVELERVEPQGTVLRITVPIARSDERAPAAALQAAGTGG
ncbi:MAG TPA: sensor histidine kinase [Thermoanaerobaculia bacterium]|nr:sensor histidine kinase [Thermoanaerobaculia bacterium]